MLLADGFHDHGSWVGPCSERDKKGPGRHDIIRDGTEKDDLRSKQRRFLGAVKIVDGRYLCLCCRKELVPMFPLPEPYDGCAY